MYIKYLIKIREVAAEHCLDDDILEDYFTEPLQGRKLHDHIMGIPEKVYGPRTSPHASIISVRS